MRWLRQARRLACADADPMRRPNHERLARYLTYRLARDIILDGQGRIVIRVPQGDAISPTRSMGSILKCKGIYHGNHED